jgi:hypothetical protein
MSTGQSCANRYHLVVFVDHDPKHRAGYGKKNGTSGVAGGVGGGVVGAGLTQAAIPRETALTMIG